MYTLSRKFRIDLCQKIFYFFQENFHAPHDWKILKYNPTGHTEKSIPIQKTSNNNILSLSSTCDLEWMICHTLKQTTSIMIFYGLSNMNPIFNRQIMNWVLFLTHCICTRNCQFCIFFRFDVMLTDLNSETCAISRVSYRYRIMLNLIKKLSFSQEFVFTVFSISQSSLCSPLFSHYGKKNSTSSWHNVSDEHSSDLQRVHETDSSSFNSVPFHLHLPLFTSTHLSLPLTLSHPPFSANTLIDDFRCHPQLVWPSSAQAALQNHGSYHHMLSFIHHILSSGQGCNHPSCVR